MTIPSVEKRKNIILGNCLDDNCRNCGVYDMKIYCPLWAIHFTNQFFDCISTVSDYDLRSWTRHDTSDGSQEKKRNVPVSEREGRKVWRMAWEQKKEEGNSPSQESSGQGQCVWKGWGSRCLRARRDENLV